MKKIILFYLFSLSSVLALCAQDSISIYFKKNSLRFDVEIGVLRYLYPPKGSIYLPAFHTGVTLPTLKITYERMLKQNPKSVYRIVTSFNWNLQDRNFYEGFPSYWTWTVGGAIGLQTTYRLKIKKPHWLELGIYYSNNWSKSLEGIRGFYPKEDLVYDQNGQIIGSFPQGVSTQLPLDPNQPVKELVAVDLTYTRIVSTDGFFMSIGYRWQKPEKSWFWRIASSRIIGYTQGTSNSLPIRNGLFARNTEFGGFFFYPNLDLSIGWAF